MFQFARFCFISIEELGHKLQPWESIRNPGPRSSLPSCPPGGERVPFERVLAHHLNEVRKLRSTSGLTWRSITSLLTQAGARRADGSLISADQLRVGYARLVRHAEEAVDSPPPKAISRSARGQNGVRSRPPAAAPRETSERPSWPLTTVRQTSPQSNKTLSDTEEVSEDEIALALTRLTNCTRTFRPKQRGGRRKAGYFVLGEEAGAQRGGENSRAAPLRDTIGALARTFRRYRPSSENAKRYGLGQQAETSGRRPHLRRPSLVGHARF